MNELTKQNQEMGLQPSSFKKYYGYVFNISKEMLDEHRYKNQIKEDDFIEIIVNFVDKKRSIRISYLEFCELLLNKGVSQE